MRIGVAISVAACALVALCAISLGVPSQRKYALWRLVHHICEPDKRLLGYATPCLDVDPDRHYALVRAWLPDELLLVPTVRVTGIEDPILLTGAVPDYWKLAWEERHRLPGGKPLAAPRMIGLAVNSAFSRTQDQLHIHIDCLRPEVQSVFQAHAHRIGPEWTRVELLPGDPYHIMRLPRNALGGPSPFLLLAQAVGESPTDMARQSLFLTSDGSHFYLLRQAFIPNSKMRGHSEELLDHLCEGVGSPT